MRYNKITWNILLFLFSAFASVPGALAQEEGTYSIISVNGRIVDQKSGKAFHVGEKVSLQTTLQFGTSSDRAVLVSPSRERYKLELPPASSGLLVSSDHAIREIKSRPQLATSTRGSVLTSKGISVETLKDYFNTDSFTIIGNHLKMPVKKQDAGKFDLALRYQGANGIEEVLFPDFTIRYHPINCQHIDECFILLHQDGNYQPVKRVKLYFLSEKTLFEEFEALLASLDIPKKGTPGSWQELKQYCTDVYGTMDEQQLHRTILRFFDGVVPENISNK